MAVPSNSIPERALPTGSSLAGTNPPGVRSRSFTWRARWAAIGAAIAVVAGTGGVAFSGATNAQITPSQTLITPCRIMDTRSGTPNVGPRSTPLAGGETYSIQVTGTNGNCTIPSGTSGVVMNVTIVGPGANGFLTVFPGGATRPTASNLNYVTGQAPTPNQVTVALGTTGQVSFFASGGPVNVIADVAGYTTAARLTNDQLAQNRWDQDLARPATVPVGVSPQGVAFDGSNIWVVNSGSNNVSRIDPATGSSIGSPIPLGVGVSPREIAFDGTTVWVTCFNTDSVVRIDPITGAVEGSPISVGDGPIGIDFDGTNIWVANFSSNNVTRINAATGIVVGSPIAVANGPRSMAFDGANMWVTSFNSNTITRISAATGTVVGSPITVGNAPIGPAFDGTTMWVPTLGSDSVSRVDATTGIVIGSPVVVADNPLAAAFDGTTIWVASNAGAALTRFDAATGAIVGTPIAVENSPQDIAFDGTNMWVTRGSANSVTKIRAS